MRILFVDNHDVFARTVTEAFLAAHEVEIVQTVARAKQALAMGSHEVALVDHDLDDGSGDELVRWARAQGHGLPIVAVSAHDEGNDSLIRAGATAICAKSAFARIGRVLAELLGMFPAQVARAATGDDRAEMIERADGLVLLVVDGAGGTGRGGAAADAVVAMIHAGSAGALSTIDLAALLGSIDRRLVKAAGGGQAAAAVATVTSTGIRGASVGDCEAWLVTATESLDLTERQVRKPLLGSGAATVVPFVGPLDGTLVLATDGLFKYASPARIRAAARERALETLPSRLTELVRLRSGDLPDDLGVIACRPSAI